MAKRVKKDYFGLSPLVSLILVIIPVTAWLCGALARFQEKRYIAALIRFVFGFTIVWVLDIISMLLSGRIARILDM